MKTTRLFLILAVLFTVRVAATAQPKEVLRNTDIVSMLKLGLSEDIVLSKIQTTPNDFDMSTNMLLALQKDKVPNNVITAMMAAAQDPGRKVQNLSDPTADRPAGIYYNKPDGGMASLEYTNYTSGQTDAAAQHLVSGLINAKHSLMIGGKSSRQVFKETPVFHFYTEALDGSAFSGYGVASPNSFACVKFTVNKNSRKLIVGKSSALGSESGIDEKAAVEFRFEEISPGSKVYKVTFPSTLEPGEYGFIHTGTLDLGVGGGIHGAAGTNRVFDFSVQ